MTDGRHPDAMDSAPCPECDRNQNGIFSERYDHRWRCCKCGTIFEGPIPARLRRYRTNAAEYRLQRHLQDTTTDAARDGFRIEDRAEEREHAFADFAGVVVE